MASKIEWTEETVNPTTGCTLISPGCANCYARTLHARLRAMRQEKYNHSFKSVRMHPGEMAKTVKRAKNPTTFFVGSMSDIFHDKVSDEFIRTEIFATMSAHPQHRYMLLTKRPERMLQVFEWMNPDRPPPGVMFGTSVENRKHGLPRIKYLREIKRQYYPAVTFLSIEPLLEDLGRINFIGIDFVIVGGESGHGARPMKVEWVDNIKAQCETQGVGFFFKQWGAYGEDGVKRSKSKNGRLLHGKLHHFDPAEYIQAR